MAISPDPTDSALHLDTKFIVIPAKAGISLVLFGRDQHFQLSLE